MESGPHNVFMGLTLKEHRRCVAYLISVVDREYERLAALTYANEEQRLVETLVHATRKNPSPKYSDFDDLFPRYPSYYRRGAITAAVGIVKSYRSNLANWEKDGRKGSPPRLALYHFSFPVLYHGQCYKEVGAYKATVKLFDGKEWLWHDISLVKTDVDYMARHHGDAARSAPVLQKRHKRFELRYAFEASVPLADNDIKEAVAVSVDIGLNHACVCAAVKPDGTVVGRRVISLPEEKARQRHAAAYISRAMRKHGNRRTPRLWKIAKDAAKGLNAKAAAQVMAFCDEVGATVLVMEHLDLRRMRKGRIGMRLHLWRARSLQDMLALRAHLSGIRVYTVNAWNTSRLAFDGSGRVKRGKEIGRPYSVCVFSTGKEYNADLNAAYNIAARYFIREHEKTTPATTWLRIAAKVPAIRKRSQATLSDLISLAAGLAPVAA